MRVAGCVGERRRDGRVERATCSSPCLFHTQARRMFNLLAPVALTCGHDFKDAVLDGQHQRSGKQEAIKPSAYSRVEN